MPYTVYSPFVSSSDYDHPRKVNHRRSREKYRSAEGVEYNISHSLHTRPFHKTKLKSCGTEY